MRSPHLSITLAIVFVATAGLAKSTGVVVETVAATGAAAQAGINVGDLLTSWQRGSHAPGIPGPAGGVLDDPFDVQYLRIEEAPRGGLVVNGERSGAPFSVKLPLGALGFKVRPVFSGADLLAYRKASLAAASGDHDIAAAAYEKLAITCSDAGDWRTAAWLFDQACGAQRTATSGEEADRLRESALEAAAHSKDALLPAWLLETDAGRLAEKGQLKDASEIYQRALEIRQQQPEQNLSLASGIFKLGAMAYVLGDHQTAEQLWRRSVEIRERLAPNSLELTHNLNNLAVIALEAGDVDLAEDLNHRCLTIREQLAPDSLDVAQTLTNLGNAASVRGDLATDETLQRRALTIIEGLAPESLEVATSAFNLGGIALDRGDLVAAKNYFQQALELRRRLQPEGLAVAGAVDALAMVALREGDLAQAEVLNRRALSLRKQYTPRSPDVAGSLTTQGFLADALKRPKLAEEYLQAAVAILESSNPNGVELGECLSHLGSVVYRNGDTKRAEAMQRRAFSIIQAIAPHSVAEAESLHQLGIILRDRGRRQKALELMRRALDDLEAQSGRLGGATERRASFRGPHMDMYRDTLHLLIEEGRLEEAFSVLERSRAHAQLAMLAERDLMFSADIPIELERRRRKVATESDRILEALNSSRAARLETPVPGQRGIGGLVPSQESEHESALFARLQKLRCEQEEIRSQIRNASPRLAALTYPQPLDVSGAVAALDPGTALLAYSIGEAASYLFVVEKTTTPLSVFPLDTTEPELSSLAQRFRDCMRPGSEENQECTLLAGELSAILLGPATERIARADRLVIMPDGPLHLVPFAALADPLTKESGRYLVVSRPLSFVASATVFAELEKQRRERGAERVDAFGDPLVAVADDSVGSSMSGVIGGTLAPLPGSRAEVLALGQIFGHAATLYMDENASEEKVKAIGPDATILHLAVHGSINQELPMESALVLATPNQSDRVHENGLLQVWEIFDEMRLDADLVTLSACDTALGENVPGEGLTGMIQAFQYAGSRTVLASLWSVSDQSTAELMRRFYTHLRSGMAKDEALRAAQIELISAPVQFEANDGSTQAFDARQPFYWATFQVYGDWQ